MSRISEQEGKIGNIEAVCPNCNAQLEKFPLRKINCKICSGEIYSRKRPFDLQKVLLTKTDADKIEYQWAIESDCESFPTLQSYYEEKDREKRVLESLRGELDREPTSKEFKRKILITELFEHRQKNLASYSQAGIEKVQILSSGNCCNKCRKQNGKIYPITEIPNPPVSDCEDDYCRCTYIAITR